jgi:hypothetical protein
LAHQVCPLDVLRECVFKFYRDPIRAIPDGPNPLKGGSSGAGIIAGGVVGGIAVVSIAVAEIFYLR